MKNRSSSMFLTLALASINLVALNYLVAGWSSARIDLTQENRYSISETTTRTLRNLDEQVTVIGYFSARTHPKLAPLVPQISDLLDEYASASRGRLTVQFLDPGENEEVEEQASQRYGVKSTPFQLASKYESGIVNAYFALVIKYGDQYKRYGFEDLIEVTPTPDGDVDVRLRNLEYDLTRAIRKVVTDFRRNSDLFASLDEQVSFTAIMSPSTLPSVFKDVPAAVETATSELAEKAGGKLTVEFIDPTTDPALAEQVYQRYGARPLQLGLLGDSGEFYLYGILQIGDRAMSIDLARTDLSAADIREAVEGALRRATPGFIRTIGVASPDPTIPPEVLRQLQMQGQAPQMPPPQFEAVRQALGASYEVKPINLDSPGGVQQDIDVMLVLKPNILGALELYNIDQFMMRGGRVVLCAGNYDVNFGQQGLSVLPMVTGLDDWLAHNGVFIDKTLVLDDQNQPLPIPEVRQTAFGSVQTWRMAPYPYLVQVAGDGFVNQNVSGGLQAVGLYWASPVRVDETKTDGLELIPLLRTSEVAWTGSDLTAVQTVDYQIPHDTSPIELAVALDGRFKSYFAGKEIPTPSDEKITPVSRVTIEESPETRLVVISNSEFLSDFVARALGSTESGFFAENLKFMENLIDWTTQESDMIAIRSRGASPPRLDRKDRRAEVAIEAMNYILPAAFVLLLGLWRFNTRRNTRSMFEIASKEVSE